MKGTVPRIAGTPETSRPAANALLSIRNLEIIYPQRERVIYAVNGVSLEIEAGSAWGFVGETGCGKSSLARAIAGLLVTPGRISAGTVTFDGDDLNGLRSRDLRRLRATDIAFMPQNALAALHPVLSIGRQFRDVLRVSAPELRRREWRPQAERALEQVGIADPPRVLGGYVHELSGGMAQRVVLALTIIRNPRIVIADEPTTGLDLRILRQSMEVLTRMRTERGTTTIIVTHDLGVLAHYCSNVAVMYAGQVVEVGDVEAVMAHPTHPYTRGLIASVPRRGQPLSTVPGSVPFLDAPPVGCAFLARCTEQGDPRCATTRPPLREVAPRHQVASFYLSDPEKARS